MKKLQNLRNNKGITLIALIITVIVMIILAGVAINLTIGENGIFIQTKIAEEEHRGGTVEEQRDLWRGDRELYKHVGNDLKSLDELLADLRGKNLLTDEEVEIIKRDKVITIGSHVIDFSFEEIEIDYSKLPAGLYQTGTTTLIKSWEQLKEDGELVIDENKTLVKLLLNIEADFVISNEIEIIGEEREDGSYSGQSIAGSECGIDRVKITGVYIPSSVRRINNQAFISFYDMKKLIIENGKENEGLQYIGEFVFEKCTELVNIEIPDSVTYIGGWLFHSCTNLESVILGKGITRIEQGTFRYCKNLKTIVISDNVTSLRNDIFSDCTNLENVILGKGINSISSNMFRNCNLKTIEMRAENGGYGNIGIENKAIIIQAGNNIYVPLVVGTDYIPDIVTSIGEYAFSGRKHLTSINIPNSVKSIGGYAFENCTSLTQITIPNSVTRISEGAFAGWTESQTINVPFKESEVPSGWGSDWNKDCNATIKYLE